MKSNVMTLREWLASWPRTNSVNRRRSTYGWKHIAERRIRAYVSNEEFIATARELGFIVQMIPNSPNAWINLSNKAIHPPAEKAAADLQGLRTKIQQRYAQILPAYLAKAQGGWELDQMLLRCVAVAHPDFIAAHFGVSKSRIDQCLKRARSNIARFPTAPIERFFAFDAAKMVAGAKGRE